jgi:hypothetical protein
MYYNARWYDPALGRFAQADSIIPDGVQGLDRYAYVNNNPMRYTDPTGHCSQNGDDWCYHAKPVSTIRLKPTSTPSPTLNPFLPPVFVKPTSTPAQMLIPAPTSTVMPTPTNTPKPIPTINPDNIATGIDIGSIVADAYNVGKKSVPSWVSVAVSGISQLIGDSNDDYTSLQESARTGVNILEDVATGGFAGLAGGGVFVGMGGPVNPAAYIGGAAALGMTAYLMDSGFNKLNQKSFYPLINKLP